MAELQDRGGQAVVPAEPLLRGHRREQVEQRRVGEGALLGLRRLVGCLAHPGSLAGGAGAEGGFVALADPR
jgi:hypothetical protein